MTASDQLVEQCAAVLRQPPGSQRHRQAKALGAKAANDNHDMGDVVASMVRAASETWNTQPSPTGETAASVRALAVDLLHDLNDVLQDIIAGMHDHLRQELSDHDSERSRLVTDLLTGRADPGHLAERAHRYGIRLSGTHVVTVATATRLSDAIVRDIDTLLAARFGDGNILTTTHDNHLVCISAAGLRGLPAELAHHLLAHLGPSGWRIAVGRAYPGINGIATSLNEARNTLDLAERLGFTTPVLYAADLLVFPVLLRDRDAITDLVTTVLGPLQQARGGAQPYLDTLSVLFDNQGNQTATARQMHLSVRAVTYRLDRIKAFTGYHPSEPTQRFTLHTAVLGARLLGWPHENRSS